MKRKAGLSAAIAAMVLCAGAASAQEYVHGYTRADGTYVQGYYRSSPNSTRMDNYSTRGNVNPYTGAVGTRDPYYTPPSYQPVYTPPVYTPPVYEQEEQQQEQQQDDGMNDDSGACCRR